MSVNEREAAFKILTAAERDKTPLNEVIRTELKALDKAAPQERALIRRLATGVYLKRMTLDHCIDLYSKTPVSKMQPVLKRALRLGAYQILFLDRVPDHAAVNESVRLIKRHGLSRLSGLVNAVLRKIASEKDSIDFADTSIRYSVPKWIVSLFTEQYGEEVCEDILKSFDKEPPLCVRIDERLDESEREALIKDWEAAGIEAVQNSVLPYAYALYGAGDVTRLKGFSEGHIYVQDPSSMMVAEYAGAKEGDTIADVCASPGGKILHLYGKLKGNGTFFARDVSSSKCERLRENAARMRADIVIEERSALLPDADMEGKVDVLICDVPCSGLGVLSRKADLRYRVRPEDLEELKKLQFDIVKASAPMVKEGGRLVYSTCTLNKGENEEQALRIEKELPFRMREMKTIMPGSVGSDGFFLAVFDRI